jgi:hypothetical protein
MDQSFLIVLAKKDDLVRELERLARRARRLGSMPITWAFGEIVHKQVRVRRHGVDAEQAAVLGEAMSNETRTVPFVQMTLSGAAPRLNGWTFAAVIQNLEGMSILRNVPGVEREIPAKYRTRGPICDHCQTKRNRNDTYLLVDEGGKWMQVGSGCLVDFLGHVDPHAVASYAELLASAAGLCGSAEGDEEGGFGGRGKRLYSLIEYLACVAAEIREGGWMPKSRAENPAASTAEMAAERLDPSPNAKARDRSVTDADRALAEDASEWGLALDKSGERMNDYLWNLHAVAKAGVTEPRTLGIAASMVAAYTKAEERKRELAARKPSEYVGEVGERRHFALTLSYHRSFETPFGYKSLYGFRDEQDNVFIWFTMGGDDQLTQGHVYTVLGTIKEHEDYKGTKQTVLSRCSAMPHDPAAYADERNEEIRKALTKKAKAGPLSADEQTQLDALKKAAREASRQARKPKKAPTSDAPAAEA